MSACPICNEPAIDRDLLALGCGHVLCRPCFDKMHVPGSILHCPFCKQRIYESEVRKLYLYSLDQYGLQNRFSSRVELSENEKQMINNAVHS